MSDTLLILFPGVPGEALPWALWRDGMLLGEGAGSDVADAVAALEPPPKVAAIVPAADAPLYRIEKRPALAKRQGAWAVIGQGGMVLRRGHELDQVLRFFDKGRFKVVD